MVKDRKLDIVSSKQTNVIEKYMNFLKESWASVVEVVETLSVTSEEHEETFKFVTSNHRIRKNISKSKVDIGIGHQTRSKESNPNSFPWSASFEIFWCNLDESGDTSQMHEEHIQIFSAMSIPLPCKIG